MFGKKARQIEALSAERDELKAAKGILEDELRDARPFISLARQIKRPVSQRWMHFFTILL